LSRVRYEAGQVVDRRYELLGLLGSGGMNQPVKPRDRQTGATVGLKIPHAGLIGDPATFSRLLREAEIGRRLRHPNVQRLVAEGRLADESAPYLVFEYVDGQILRALLAREAPLPVDEAVALARQLVDALAYCHAQGVVHRDVKPENILIGPAGQVKLVDFGIAQLRGARRLTERNLASAVGTPDYMAPEQVRGQGGDERTDVYAVGVVLYELLAGQVPYQGDSPLAVMSQRVSADPPLLRRARPETPAGLEAVVFRALRREPAERYQTMAALRDDLEHLDRVRIPDQAAAGSGAEPTAPDRARPWPARTGAVVLAILAALAVLGVLAELLQRAQVAP
jgi:serine/threonine-protein kinase